MAGDAVIRAEGLGKKYVIGHEAKRERYVALRDVLVRGVHDSWRKTADMFRGGTIVSGNMREEFWALKDVSFEVKRGEVLGIIGRNGAGKSTLLKVLSRITEPSEGRVMIDGRVVSLLEVGTGFHPELTGRENIYLNGAILGMSRTEVRRRFDEIVAFAEVEKFLDTPVKRYSSGMYVRLAFAVAAHLETEILLVDEVLAVGDAGFQKKCLGKMGQVNRKDGRTVLVVSHNMAVIQEITNTSILLENGALVMAGNPRAVVESYLASLEPKTILDGDSVDHPNRLIGMHSIVRCVKTHSGEGAVKRHFMQGEPVNISIDYDGSDVGVPIAGLGVIVDSSAGLRIASMATYFYQEPPFRLPPKGQVTFKLTEPKLNPGVYFLNVCVAQHQQELLDMIQPAASIEILPSDIYSTGFLLSGEDGVVAAYGTLQVVVG